MLSEGPNVDYYSWRTEATSLGKSTYRVRTKPGVASYGQLDIPQVLLAESLVVGVRDTVLNLNCGTGLVGVVAAKLAANGKVLLADANFVAAQAANATLELNAISNAEVYFSYGLGQFGEKIAVDVAAVRLPKGRLPALQLILDAFVALKEGGRFYLAGKNDEGIQSAIKHAEELFGQKLYPLVYRKGCRVVMATKRTPAPTLPDAFQSEWLGHESCRQLSLRVGEMTFPVCTRPGVFSWDKLDAGTLQLLETMSIGQKDAVLDMGCGCGILGLVAATMATAGTVTMVDADVNALDAARCTITLNAVTNCQVIASDVTSAVRSLTFDVVLTNLPFHLAHDTNYDIAVQFIQGAASVLKANGRFFLVANRFLPYESVIQDTFGNVLTLRESRQYKVLSAVRTLR